MTKPIEEFIGKVIQGDCLEVMKTMPDNSVDLIVTSPPYNLDIKYDNYDDNKSLEKYYLWCNEWIKESYRILKIGGRFCLEIGCFQSAKQEPTYSTFTQLFIRNGFIFREFVIWNKNQIPKRTAWGSWLSPSNPRILPPFEMIINFHKVSPKLLHKGETDLTKEEFINYTNGIWIIAPEKNEHPAPYPNELVKRCLKMNTYRNDVVLDPFAGSGTTAVASQILGRRWIGIEISPEYCEIARKRLKTSVEQQKLEANKK